MLQIRTKGFLYKYMLYIKKKEIIGYVIDWMSQKLLNIFDPLI